MLRLSLTLLGIYLLLVFVYPYSTFAMHDSTLDVNTWIASNNGTGLQTSDLNKGPVSPMVGGEGEGYVSLRVNLQPHENEFLADDGWYKIDSFQFATDSTEEFCPSNNCEYDIEDGEFRPNDISGGYVFDGKLKVSTTEGDTIKSKFYLLNADLEKAGSEETSSGLTEILEGDIGFGGTTFEPEFQYRVVNGTLEVDEQSPTLSLRGE